MRISIPSETIRWAYAGPTGKQMSQSADVPIPKIEWAKYRKTIEFELSACESFDCRRSQMETFRNPTKE